MVTGPMLKRSGYKRYSPVATHVADEAHEGRLVGADHWVVVAVVPVVSAPCGLLPAASV